ncbi:TonB-dependent receptor [Pontibacter sp. G13]|uniref:TonB-dependent receptor n=1 Tax=Pontibacter sp. G13 TaxID=3074898 RepID=UPI002889B742|nr:TonB-dependent receptor [Pontibacter sp. G13]WNJ19840.1 TonB-dependent receptor [Pontibacter sp. G13]
MRIWTLLLTLGWTALALPSFSQTLTGTLRGKVLNGHEQAPIEGVSLQLAPNGLELESDSVGKFVFHDLPVGRYDLSISHPQFQTVLESQIWVGSSRDALVEIELTPRWTELEEVVIPSRTKGEPRNPLGLISTLTFEVEETRKFAGGLDDPARVAANFPGISANPFISDNMISIRGNSPRGMQYRVEGVDIPNPNHFARIGSSGGSFTIFSNQVLDNSDFFIGAFPAGYGNATAGVFDIRFRNGNSDHHEFTLQAGVLGVDLAAEGPLKQGGNSSFLVNYRFATLNLAAWFIRFLSVPTYQDLSFKLHLPTQRAGTFDVFGMGGLSQRPKPAETDSTLWEYDLDRFENLLASDMGVLGLKHTLPIGNKTLWKTSLAGTFSQLVDRKTYLEDDFTFRTRANYQYRRTPFSVHTALKHTFSPRHTHETGATWTYTHHDFSATDFDYVDSVQFTLADEAGTTRVFQAYSQSQFRLANAWTWNVGLHMLHFQMTGQTSWEPRTALRWQLTPKHRIMFGYGLHSQIEHWGTYMTRIESEGGQVEYPNRDLPLMRAHHAVVGYQGTYGPFLRLRAEVYFQSLFDVPVEVDGTYSVLNLDELNQLRILETGGTGQNQGIDLGISRFKPDDWYFVLNGSVFESTYTDAEGNRHRTAYDLGHKVNLLLGREKVVGKKKGGNHRLGLNGTLTWMGGQPYTPIDLTASAAARQTVYDERFPYSMTEQDMWIFDFTLTLVRNHPKYTGKWAFQIKNLFQNAAPEYREYDRLSGEEVLLKGASVLPVMSYQVDF